MDIFEYEEDGTKMVEIFCNRVNSDCTIEEIVELVEAIIEETPPFLDSDLIAVHFFQAVLEKNSAKFFDNIEKM